MRNQYISKNQLEALLLIGLEFAECSFEDNHKLDDLQTQMRVVYQQLLDGDKDEFTIDQLTQYIINLDICIV